MSLRKYVFFFIFFVLISKFFAQLPTQTIKGVVLDISSKAPLPFANIILMNTNPILGTSTNAEGNFRLSNIPIGRYDIRVSYIGYEPSIVREVQVSSAKEIFLTISLKENSFNLSEIVIKPNVNKEQSLNSMASVSARMLSVDEASRYAGGFDDPARLVAAFAGVASNIGNNGIVIRGNSPKYFQWKMEGVEIPNPNHFADLSSFGGGGLTALSTKLLANSDFFTGAFPSEYSNALSGVFDIFMRIGNNQKNEHSIEFGVIGIEVGSEGPFKDGSNSSYLFNYRYSTLGLIAPLLPDNGGGISYQDLSFKLNFPTKNIGTVSVWGIGLTDKSGQDAKTDSSKWFYKSDREKQKVKQFMAASGITHTYFLNNKTYLQTTLAATVNGIALTTDILNNTLKLLPENRINNKSWNFVLSSFVNNKFSPWHTNKTGIILTGLMYDLLLENVLFPESFLQAIVKENSFSSLLSAYSSSSLNLSEKLTMNVGVNAQLFTLNNHYTLEPRIGLKWQITPIQSFGFAYGLHSRLERLNYYFSKDFTNNNNLYNKNLDFTKAHHLVLSYDLDLSSNTHLKVEPYFQQLYNVPVIMDSSFSFINLENDWFFNYKLVNIGKGINYGLDLTLEQYLTKGFYYLVAASIFDSKYKGGDDIWRDTRFNRNYLLNILAGKEWQLGENKANVLGINIRLSYQGGNHYSPANIEASKLIKDVVFDETKAYSKQLPSSFNVHFTISYKINKERTSYEIALKVLNATMTKDFYGFQYNYTKNTIDEQRESIFIPNLSFKVEF